MKIKNLTLPIILFLCISIGCNSDDPQKKGMTENSAIKAKTKKPNLNISILLDLSDRIDSVKKSNPGMEFYKRDLGYIESISKGFEKHLSSKPIIQDDDHIQVYFEPEPLNSEINNLANRLKLSFTKANTTKESILNISKQYTLASTEIYRLAMTDNNYIGSDIWGFFKNKVKDYCIKPNHRNILFILTDGYMFHQDSKFVEGARSSYLTSEVIRALKLNTSKYKEVIETKGYGFIKANDDLSDLEVVILGVNPAKGNPYEGDVINQYWLGWLKEMKVKSPVMDVIPADLPSNLNNLISNYINRP